MTTTIVTRASKGGRLSFTDMDNNLLNLQATADAAAVNSTVVASLALKANSASLSAVATSGKYSDLSGVPVIPTIVSTLTNDAGYQTSAQVNTAIQAVVGAAPAALNTLAKIDAQLASDESVAAALTTTVSGKADKATTIAGYGITDAYTKTQVDSAITSATPSFTTLTGKPTTLNGYGITDAMTASAISTAIAVETSRATAAEALLAPKASPTFTGTVSGITAAMVGLSNVNNTSDANKPVSTAQAAINATLAPLASPALTGTPTAPTAAALTSTTQVATTAFTTTAIAVETSRATAAEATLTTALNAAVARITALENALLSITWSTSI